MSSGCLRKLKPAHFSGALVHLYTSWSMEAPEMPHKRGRPNHSHSVSMGETQSGTVPLESHRFSVISQCSDRPTTNKVCCIPRESL